jgi:hypothetical protein
MEKTLTKVARYLQKISKVAAMQIDWEVRLSREPECDSRMKTCAEISKKPALEDKKEDPILKRLKKYTPRQELP